MILFLEERRFHSVKFEDLIICGQEPILVGVVVSV